jgi:hypothetical protein
MMTSIDPQAPCTKPARWVPRLPNLSASGFIVRARNRPSRLAMTKPISSNTRPCIQNYQAVGVRRFFVQAPDRYVIDIVSHRD